MNVFRLHAEKRLEGSRDVRTYVVIADNLFDAISFVPEGFHVNGVKIQVASVVGPGRVIGCFAPPTVH